jgi:hypothetical protein
MFGSGGGTGTLRHPGFLCRSGVVPPSAVAVADPQWVSREAWHDRSWHDRSLV